MTTTRTPRSRQPLLQAPRIGVLPIFATLSFIAMLALLGWVGKLNFEGARSKNDPHRNALVNYGVRPLFDEELVYDVGVSVFAKTPINETKWPECSAEAERKWHDKWLDDTTPKMCPGQEEANVTAEDQELYDLAYGSRYLYFKPSECFLRHVPETKELWSGVVARNLTLENGSVNAAVDLEIPTELLKLLGEEPKLHHWESGTITRRPDVYAVVTLIPHVDDLRWAHWYKGELDDLPLVGLSLLEEVEDSVGVMTPEHRPVRGTSELRERKTFLESLSFRVPLLQDDCSPKATCCLRTSVKAALLRRTAQLNRETFSARHEALMRQGCLRKGLKRHRFLCMPWTYQQMGHWYASYAFGEKRHFKDPEWYSRRYPPHLLVTSPGPLEYTPAIFGNQTSWNHTLQIRLSAIDDVRMGMLRTMRSPPREAYYRTRNVLQEQDRVDLMNALVGLGPRVGVAFGLLLRAIAHAARYTATALTVLYWFTRQTNAGISRSGLCFVLLGSLLRIFAGTWDYYKHALPWRYRHLIWPIILLPLVPQLRLLFPVVFEKEIGGGRPTALSIELVPPTSRERRSAKLSPNWRQLAVLTTILACLAYALLVHPVLLLPGTHIEEWHETYNEVYPGSRVWNDMYDALCTDSLEPKLWGLPLAQALISSGQLAQLVLNYRCGTFAGSYTVTCYLKVMSLIALISPYLVGSAYFDGLYLSAVAQAALVIVEAWQAWRYPRVEQEEVETDKKNL